MKAIDIFRMTLEREVKNRSAEMSKLAERIAEHGINDRIGWLREPMRVDADGKLAAEVLKALDEQTLPLAEIRNRLGGRRDREVGFINAEHPDPARLFDLQALHKMVEALDWVLAEQTKEAA